MRLELSRAGKLSRVESTDFRRKFYTLILVNSKGVESILVNDDGG